ncbi:hypothetical protein P3T35_002400 [Kitasatospora sp. GP30]|uniref:WXG100-like domain-containing protein n=1 Tax=Kitasatospora sp. GP30 TaxID=3035084 RepID=UPI000C70C5D6|nr:hypothetical protein [Kitasatospora sp. GP30]MDH6140392.1 hypothetical protein [Kitasatospora sp. GP30]
MAVDAPNASLPDDLQNLLMILVGNKWPTGNETALRAEADAWTETAKLIRDSVRDLTDAKSRLDQGLSGSTKDAVDTYLAKLATTDDAALPLIAQCCDAAADALNNMANEIETLRIEIIGALVVLAIQLAIDAAMFLFGGAEAAPVEIAFTRAMVWAFLRKALISAVTRVSESVLAQVGFDLLAQVIELGQHHRKSIDGGELGTAAINGAIGGAVGVGAGWLGKGLSKGLGKGLGKGFTSLTGHEPGRLTKGAADLVWNTGYGALTGMAEGAAQDAAFGLSGDYVSGAANGAFAGAWGARHGAMNPGNKFSISPADHIEGWLNGKLEGPRPPGGGSSGGGSSGGGSSEIELGPVGDLPHELPPLPPLDTDLSSLSHEMGHFPAPIGDFRATHGEASTPPSQSHAPNDTSTRPPVPTRPLPPLPTEHAPPTSGGPPVLPPPELGPDLPTHPVDPTPPPSPHPPPQTVSDSILATLNPALHTSS